MAIKGLENITNDQLVFELQQGGKLVIYQYCISIFIMTFRRSSSIYYIRKDKSAFLSGLPYTLLSLAFGWWGIPWGPIYTIGSVFNNTRGGKDVTEVILKELQN